MRRLFLPSSHSSRSCSFPPRRQGAPDRPATSSSCTTTPIGVTTTDRNGYGQVRDALYNLTTKGIVTDARSANADLLFSNF